MSYSNIIKKVSEELNLPLEVVDRTYKSYWVFIKDTINSLPLKEDINEEEFAKLKTNFNIESLGKLCVTYKHYVGVKKKWEYLKRMREYENKRRDKN